MTSTLTLTLQLPEGMMASMPPEVALHVRAYMRTATERIVALTAQIVRIVDVQVGPVALQCSFQLA
jgi:hypothetical protein